MTVATLIIAPFLTYFVVKLNQKLLIVLRESKSKIAAINAFVAENINGMRILQIYDRVASNNRRFSHLSADYRAQQLKAVRMYGIPE